MAVDKKNGGCDKSGRHVAEPLEEDCVLVPGQRVRGPIRDRKVQGEYPDGEAGQRGAHLWLSSAEGRKQLLKV